MIIASRFLVGISTAFTTALTLAIVTLTFTGKESAKAIGIFIGAGSLSGAIMPIVSQLLNQTFGWRTSFVASILLSGIGLVMVWRFLAESRDPTPRKLDFVGVALNAIGLIGIVYAFILMGSSGWNSSARFWLMGGIISLGLFIWWEKRTPDPALKLSLFKNPAFAIAVGVGLVINLVDFGMHPIWSTFLQSIQGRTPLAAAIILLPWALGAAIISPFAGRWATRWSSRSLMIIGLVVAAVTCLGTWMLTVDASVWLVVGILLPYAMAYGLANVPRTSLLMASAPANESGAVSAANSMGMETGTALGIAVFNALVARYSIANYRGMLVEKGASADNVTKAIAVLKSAVEGTVSKLFPSLSDDLLSQLAEGFKQAYTTAIGQTFTIAAIMLGACAIVVWFGMRGKVDPILTENAGAG